MLLDPQLGQCLSRHDLCGHLRPGHAGGFADKRDRPRSTGVDFKDVNL